jgi:hypothetical protein
MIPKSVCPKKIYFRHYQTCQLCLSSTVLLEQHGSARRGHSGLGYECMSGIDNKPWVKMCSDFMQHVIHLIYYVKWFPQHVSHGAYKLKRLCNTEGCWQHSWGANSSKGYCLFYIMCTVLMPTCTPHYCITTIASGNVENTFFTFLTYGKQKKYIFENLVQERCATCVLLFFYL